MTSLAIVCGADHELTHRSACTSRPKKTEGGETTAAFEPCPFFLSLDPSLPAFSEDSDSQVRSGRAALSLLDETRQQTLGGPVTLHNHLPLSKMPTMVTVLAGALPPTEGTDAQSPGSCS